MPAHPPARSPARGAASPAATTPAAPPTTKPGADPWSVRDGELVVDVHVQPRAGRDALVGRHGDALKVRVTAPPVDGRANDATCAVLAGVLGVAPSRVRLVSGATSRVKRLAVALDDPAAGAERLRAAVAEAG